MWLILRGMEGVGSGEIDGAAAVRCAFVGSEDDFKGAEGFAEVCKRHVLACVEGIEEGLELRLVGVIGHVAGIQHLHGKLSPTGFVRVEFVGMQLVIQKASLATDQMGVEVIRLEAVHNRGCFADGTVLEFQDRDA